MAHRTFFQSFLLASVLLALACATAPQPKDPARPAPASAGQALTQPEAAEMAAYLANAACEQHFGKKPFLPSHWTAELIEGRWHWGHWDPAGASGYSAIVSFDADGSHPDAQVFFSSDQDSGTGAPQAKSEKPHVH